MYQTIDEIRKQYDGEWVMLVNYKEEKNAKYGYTEVVGGEVAFHEKYVNHLDKHWDEALAMGANMTLYPCGVKRKGFRFVLA